MEETSGLATKEAVEDGNKNREEGRRLVVEKEKEERKERGRKNEETKCVWGRQREERIDKLKR